MSPETEVQAPANSTSNYFEAMDAKLHRMRASWQRAAVWLVGLFAAFIGGSIAIGELAPYFERGYYAIVDFVQIKNLPGWIPVTVALLTPALIFAGLVNIIPAFLVWWERKVAGHVQSRLGPMNTGGWHGWAQTIADGIKLLLKEIIEPDGIDKWVFRFAPLVVFLPAYMSFAPLPFGDGLVGANFDIGLLYVMAISGIATVAILMVGWASANKYSILGGLRAAAQVVSYEIPRLLSAVPVVMWAGTLSLTGIEAAQSGFWWGVVPRWFIFYPVIGQVSFLIYLITTVAETNRVPFDVPEAESELVCGFHTELGGMKFALFFLGEYAFVFVGSLLGTVLFLGGGAPLLPQLEMIPSWAWFLMKTFSLVFIFLWARWTLPRLRVDRIMDLCWKVLLEWTFIMILAMGAVIVWGTK
jgi:NADH-quinone oxidoreductase subunit H